MSDRMSTLDVSKIPPHLWSYLAGLIDGDGCFFMWKLENKRTKGSSKFTYRMNLNIWCINEPFIQWIYDVFGGVKMINRKATATRRRPLYGVEFTGNRLTQILEHIVPYIQLKKPNAENMLEMRRTYNGVGGRIDVPIDIQETRERCYQICRQLNTHKP